MASSVEVTNTMADNNYDKALDKAIERLLVGAGIAIEGDAVVRTPVDTGRLRGSITYATKKERSRANGSATAKDTVSTPSQKWTLHVGSNVEYAPYIEYGTKYMQKRPFLRPAMMRHRGTVKRLMKKEIQEALKNGK